MVKCKNCGRLTTNKSFCCVECRNQYRFNHQRKKRSKLERFLVKRIKEEFKNIKIKTNDRQILQENLELDILLPDFLIAFEIYIKFMISINFNIFIG